MRVLLRDASGRYYAGPGNWILDRADARDFRLIEGAIHLNTAERLGATHVVLAYDSPACNLCLPISNYNGIIGADPASGLPNQPRAENLG